MTEHPQARRSDSERQRMLDAAKEAFGTLPMPGISTHDFPERMARALDAALRAIPVMTEGEWWEHFGEQVGEQIAEREARHG